MTKRKAKPVKAFRQGALHRPMECRICHDVTTCTNPETEICGNCQLNDDDQGLMDRDRE